MFLTSEACLDFARTTIFFFYFKTIKQQRNKKTFKTKQTNTTGLGGMASVRNRRKELADPSVVA